MTSAELNYESGVPLHRQIRDILQSEIVHGLSNETEPMTEAKLTARFGVSSAPVRQALDELARTGFVFRKQGRGTFPVQGVRVDRPADLKVGDLYRYLADRGLRPTAVVEGIERVHPPAEVTRRLALEENEQVLHFVRLISVDGKPFAENDVYIRAPKEFLPTSQELADGGSAFALLERDFGIALESAENEAWATTANANHASMLGVEVGSPLLIIDTVFYAKGGLPVGWRSAAHRPDEFKYHFVTPAS